MESVNQIRKLQDRISDLNGELQSFTKMTIDLSDNEDNDDYANNRELELNKKPIVNKGRKVN